MPIPHEYEDAIKYLNVDPLHSNHHPCDTLCINAALENMKRKKQYDKWLTQQKEKNAEQNKY